MLTRQVTAVASLAACPKSWEQVSQECAEPTARAHSPCMLHAGLTGLSAQNSDDENA